MNNKILIIVSVVCMLWPTAGFSQFVYNSKSKYRAIGDSVKIIASRADIGYIPIEKPVTWQYREDNGTWQNFDYPDCDTLVFAMKNDIAIRYNVQWCDKVYTSAELSYTATDIIEGESLMILYYDKLYRWREGVKAAGFDIPPTNYSSGSFVSGTQLLVQFPSTYSGPYSLEFKTKTYHAGNYRLAWQASNLPSGIVSWYVNEIKVGEYNNDKWGGTTSFIALSGALAGPKNGTDKYGYSYNSSGYRLSKNKIMNYVEFPFTLEKDTSATIKAIWKKGQGSSVNRGLLIDQIRIVPMAQ